MKKKINKKINFFLIFLLTVTFLLLLLILVKSNYFNNFGFKIYYSLIAAKGTQKKVDESNRVSIEMAKNNGSKLMVLIHGAGSEYYDDVYGAIVWFKERGFNVVSFDYNFKAPPLEASIQLKNFVDDLLRQTGQDKLDVTGICLGGIIAKYYGEELGGADKIDKLVTIVSPAKAIPKRELAYQFDKYFSFDPEPWNEVLEKLEDKNPIKKHVYIYCKKDIIVPSKYQLSSRGNYLGLDCGHSFVNSNPEILEKAAFFLKND